MVVDALAESLGVSFKKKLFHSYCIGKGAHEGRSVYLVKPLTFMNNSGKAVREALRETGLSAADLLVVCDTLDLGPGALRLRLKGSSAGQKGLQSIIQSIGTEEFMRITIGIGRPNHKGQVIAHVLTAPRREEEELVSQAIERAARAVKLLLVEGPAPVMNEVNRKEPAS
jgi:peptidyl-tRNA hydrolase, PTH1 family